MKKYLRGYRKQKRLTQKQLSKLSGVSQNYISSFENGKTIPSMQDIIKLANALGIDKNEIEWVL